MILFEKKGLVRILLFLLNNQNSVDSKYRLKKLLELNNTSLNECLEILKKFKMVDVIKDVGPRNRTELKLTELGINITQSLDQIITILKSTKTD